MNLISFIILSLLLCIEMTHIKETSSHTQQRELCNAIPCHSLSSDKIKNNYLFCSSLSFHPSWPDRAGNLKPEEDLFFFKKKEKKLPRDGTAQEKTLTFDDGRTF